MGCCVSAASNSKRHHFNIKQSPPSSSSSAPKPNTSVEEETIVKEVLTETPSLPKPPTISSVHDENDQSKSAMLFPPAAPLPKMQENHHHQQQRREDDFFLKKPKMVFNPDELSEDASEICSTLTESVSAATEQKKEMDEEYADDVNDDNSKIRQTSPAKQRNRMVFADRSGGKSPARRSERSPVHARTGPRKDANGQRKGFGNSSDRRSRSPATRVDELGPRTGLGRCPSARRTGKSPGRIGSDLGDKSRRVTNGDGVSVEDKWPPASGESLENPLVSLECFIFL